MRNKGNLFTVMFQDLAIIQTSMTLTCISFFFGVELPAACILMNAVFSSIPAGETLLFLWIIGALVLGIIASVTISDQKVELGIVPLGAGGLALSSFLLSVFSLRPVSVVIVVSILLFSAGLYLSPLISFLRYRVRNELRGRILWTVRMLTVISFVAGCVLFSLLYDHWFLSLKLIQGLCCIFLVIVTVVIALTFPYPFIRLCVWMLTHTFYRLRVINNAVIPHSGGALIVANHLSFVDVLFLIVSTSRRVRFVTARKIYNMPWLGALCRMYGAFPISTKDSTKEIGRTLTAVREAIMAGEIVCMFPEGQVSRTGNTLRFGRGIEHIMRDLEEPIIPAYLDRAWGSMWSFEGGRVVFKLPRVIPHPITVVFGDPLPSSTKTFDIRQAVLELGAGVFRYRVGENMTLPEVFFDDMRREPFSFCMADSSGKKLNRLQTFVAGYVLARKLKHLLRDERYVGVFLPPSVGGALANVGLSILGSIAVNLNYTSSQEALLNAINECGMRYCLTARPVLEKLRVQLPVTTIFVDDLVKQVTRWDKLVALLTVICPLRMIAHRLIFGSWHNRDTNDLATVVFTSGSTGIPKGVMLTHCNILTNILSAYQIFHVRSGDGIMGVLPFFHSFGYTVTLWLTMIGRMYVVYHNNPLDAQVVGEMTRTYKPSLLIATPSFLNAYMRRCTKEDFASLRLVVVGAEKLKPSIAHAFEERFGITPLEGYGCTELSPVVSVNMPDYRVEDIHQKAHKPGTIGQPLPGLALKVVDPETMQSLGPGEPGLLMVKGATVMKGYLNQSALTADAIVDGWYKTGDIAFLDEDGFITITDRLSRFAKIAGEMVPFMRIEEAIHAFIAASETVCVVTSVPDEKRGERLVVLYAQDMDVAAVVKAIKAAGLPNLWIPDEKMFFRIEALPLLGSGKLDLAAVKKTALRMTQRPV